MEASKSFSIDALLAREPPTKPAIRDSPSPAMSSPRSRASSSPDSHKSRSYSPGSQRSLSSPAAMNPMTSCPGSFIPRPGLLNMHPPALNSPHVGFPSSLAGLFSGGAPNGGMGPCGPDHRGALMSMFPGSSAFHSPTEQAIKFAHAQGVPLDWLARSGMLVHPRMSVLDYTGMCEFSPP